MNNIAEIACDIGALEPMPVSVQKLAEAASDPDASIDDIVEAVKFDQSLTAGLLKAANSVWSGATKSIDTVRQAVVRLGVAWTLGLVIGRRMHKTMVVACEPYNLAEKELWRHSLAAAIAAGKTGGYATKPVPPSAFTAALLHDIGKMILTRYYSPELIDRVNNLIKEGAFYIDAEMEILGTDHAAVGGLVARHWQFPESLVNAIERHHDPDAEPDPILDTVHVANIVAKTLGIGLGSEQMNMEASAEAPERLGLSSGALEGLCATVLDELAKAEGIFEVKS